LEEFKIKEHFYKLAELDGLFGRAQLFIDIDPGRRDPEAIRQLPLCIDKDTIAKGSLRGFKVVEPIWSTPFSYNANDPLACDFYVPRAWFVLGKRIHADRLLTFVMREVPDILKPSYNFGGLSMTQLMESDVFQWLRTRNSVSDLIHNFSVMCLMTDMADILSGKPDKPGGLFDRAALFTQTRDNQGLTLLDKDREEMAAVNVPLAGLHELQAQAQEHQAAPSHIPLVKLLGVTPTGLNASSEGEIQVFYDFVQACKMKFYAPHFKTILQLLQLHYFGEIDDAIGFEFPSLHAPTVKELAEIRKSNAETDAIYIDKGVLDPAESRVRVAADPESGYSNLSGGPPEPPDLTGMENEHGLNEEAAQAAHERGEESAEAAHKRTLEQQANEPRAA
jgi:phage-related protein (TIGR01555 family)